MTRLAAAAFALLVSSAAFAQEPADQPMAAQVAHMRSKGCAGHPGVASPLHWSPELARAAQRIAKGEAPLAAAEKEGFRATRISHAAIKGPRQAAEAASALAKHYCESVTDPQFTDFAFDHQGSNWIVVLAARLELQELGDTRAVALKVFDLVNEARSHARRCGDETFQPAPPLHYNLRLERAAALHAQDMAAQQYLAHVARDGSTPAQRIAHAGYAWNSVGENVASGQKSAEDVVRDWLESPGHCANIMSDDFADMGVAFAVNIKSKPVVYWAQEFGRAK
jgi:uncharacterized protein YkwD